MKHRKLRAGIAAQAAAWQTLLGMQWLTVHHRFSESTADDPTTIADTSCMWQYREATITWYLPQCALLDPDSLEAFGRARAGARVERTAEAHVPDEFTEQKEFACESIARAILASRSAPL